MRKMLHYMCLINVIVLFCIAVKLFSIFPIDAQPYVEKKYAGWNGVLQAWICTRWNSCGNFIRWLNACASDFEKNHNGVYLEFIPVSEVAMCEIQTGNLTPPDLVFFSPGILTDKDCLLSLPNFRLLRENFNDCGDGHAIPVALGGYIWVYNTALCDHAPHSVDEIAPLLLPKDQPGQLYSTAFIGLTFQDTAMDSQPFPTPDVGIDLGLPAVAISESFMVDDAVERFINGELTAIPVSSADLARLIRLRESGKGVNWETFSFGNIVCSDQLLLTAIPKVDDRSEQAKLSQAFIRTLLSDSCQESLTEIGVHSVSGKRIYSDFSAYADLDILLNCSKLRTPDCFSEYCPSNSESIVRDFIDGKYSAQDALRLLGFEDM